MEHPENFSGKYCIIPAEIDIKQQVVFLVLSNHIDLETREVKISQQDIVDELEPFKFSRKAVRNALDKLEAGGLITKAPGANTRASVVYKLSTYEKRGPIRAQNQTACEPAPALSFNQVQYMQKGQEGAQYMQKGPNQGPNKGPNKGQNMGLMQTRTSTTLAASSETNKRPNRGPIEGPIEGQHINNIYNINNINKYNIYYIAGQEFKFLKTDIPDFTENEIKFFRKLQEERLVIREGNNKMPDIQKVKVLIQAFSQEQILQCLKKCQKNSDDKTGNVNVPYLWTTLKNAYPKGKAEPVKEAATAGKEKRPYIDFSNCYSKEIDKWGKPDKDGFRKVEYFKVWYNNETGAQVYMDPKPVRVAWM